LPNLQERFGKRIISMGEVKSSGTFRFGAVFEQN
jgi:hypothetical protein